MTALPFHLVELFKAGMDAILILGAAIWPNGPSPTVKRRTAHAATLWHAGRAPLVIPCGGLGAHPPSEAEAMRDLLIDQGVPADKIMPEDQSTTTFENIRNASALLQGDQVIIVTDHYHGARAKMVARHFGLRAEVAAPQMPYIPIRQYIREAVARPAYAIKLRRLSADR